MHIPVLKIIYYNKLCIETNQPINKQTNKTSSYLDHNYILLDLCVEILIFMNLKHFWFLNIKEHVIINYVYFDVLCK